MTNRPKVAILSTWNEICGIAHYTAGIKRQLEKTCDVEVLPTPRVILGNAKDVSELLAGDQYCEYLSERVKEFDHINIQFEPGILAPEMAMAMRRFKLITKHAKSMSITWHYVARRPYTPPKTIARLMLSGKMRYAIALKSSEKELAKTWGFLFKYIRNKSKTCKVSHIVHTPRDKHFVNAIFNGDTYTKKAKNPRHRVSMTPLTYFSDEDKTELDDKLAKSDLHKVLPKKKGKDTRYLGVFGFFSGYKGFETAIDALESLPPNYELLMFSSVHESTLRIEAKRDDYLGKLADHIDKRDRAIRKRNRKAVVEKSKLLAKVDKPSKKMSAASRKLLDQTFDKKSVLSDRVHFLGAVSDDDLTLGMLLCDAVLFPYINSPHTASGPMAQAVELDRRVFASRNIQFVQLSQFHDDHFIFCDIGNSIEYAQKIPKMTADRKVRKVHGYDVIDYPPLERKFTMERATDIYLEAIDYR